MYYAGIGSRETPGLTLGALARVGEFLAKKGYILRSGGADGADTAFEVGCDSARGRKEIFLPWYGFNNNQSTYIVTDSAFKLAEYYHPAYNRLSQGAKKLHARNVNQILGADLKTPVKFVVCYTPGGSGSGGTGQAIRIANDHNIPVFDFGRYSSLAMAKEEFNKFYLVISTGSWFNVD